MLLPCFLPKTLRAAGAIELVNKDNRERALRINVGGGRRRANPQEAGHRSSYCEREFSAGAKTLLGDLDLLFVLPLPRRARGAGIDEVSMRKEPLDHPAKRWLLWPSEVRELDHASTTYAVRQRSTQPCEFPGPALQSSRDGSSLLEQSRQAAMLKVILA